MPRLYFLFSFSAIIAVCLNTVASAVPLAGYSGLMDRVISENSIVQHIGGCHANNRFHYVDEIDDEVRHRHKGNNCRVQVLESVKPVEHCHASGQRHNHRGYGRVTHSHFQDSCLVDEWRQREGGGSSRGCIKIGAITFCP